MSNFITPDPLDTAMPRYPDGTERPRMKTGAAPARTTLMRLASSKSTRSKTPRTKAPIHLFLEGDVLKVLDNIALTEDRTRASVLRSIVAMGLEVYKEMAEKLQTYAKED